MKTLKTAFAAISLTSLAACQPALMHLDVPEIAQCPACECELPPVPPPIPKAVKIDIDQNKGDLDSGGRFLIEQYIYNRELIHKLWQK